MKHTYASWYESSGGQPANGYETTGNKRAAINRAKAFRHTSLHVRGGGRAVAAVVTDPDREPQLLYVWREAADGGYVEHVG